MLYKPLLSLLLLLLDTLTASYSEEYVLPLCIGRPSTSDATRPTTNVNRFYKNISMVRTDKATSNSVG